MSNLLFQLISYGSLGFVILMLVFAVWLNAEGQRISRYTTFAYVIGSVALWLLTYVLWRLPTPLGQTALWFRSMYFIGSLIPTFYYLFSLSYLFGNRMSRTQWLVALMPNLLVAWFAFGNGIVTNDANTMIQLTSGGRILFVMQFTLFVLASLGVLLYATRTRKDIDQKELFPVVAGALIAFYSIFGVLFGMTGAQDSNFILTLVSLVGSVAIVLPFLVKWRLLVDLRLVGTEIMILISLVILLADLIVSAETPFDFLFRVTVFFMLIMYGILTMRTLIRESKQLQKSELMQDQVIRMNGRLIEADRLKTRFVTLLAHQLRSPLTSVHIYMNMVRGGEFGKVPVKAQEVLKTNMDVVERLIKTTKTFLDVTGIAAEKVEIFKVETDLGVLVEKLVREAMPAAAKKGLGVRTVVAPDLPLVMCDAGVIHHVLMSLIDNALKFTEHGGVVVSVSMVDNSIEVKVTDTGRGLTDTERQSVFRVFERGMSAVKLHSKGEGLGIFIAKQFIDEHGGKMVVESRGRDKGSTFGFRIPIGE